MDEIGMGARIKVLRTELGMTQTQLAEKINSTKQTIYKYETGVITNIPLDKVKLIATALDTTPEYLAGWVSGAELKKWMEHEVFPPERIKLINEYQILERFEQLNAENQLKLLDFANDLLYSQKEEN